MPLQISGNEQCVSEVLFLRLAIRSLSLSIDMHATSQSVPTCKEVGGQGTLIKDREHVSSPEKGNIHGPRRDADDRRHREHEYGDGGSPSGRRGPPTGTDMSGGDAGKAATPRKLTRTRGSVGGP
jgi:hypothetical protein